MDYVLALVEENIHLSFTAMTDRTTHNGEKIEENENIIDFTNGALTKFLIKLSNHASQSDEMDNMKKTLTASHFSRLAEGNCSMEVSPYYSSAISGLERVADHLMNVGCSIVSPIGSEKEEYRI